MDSPGRLRPLRSRVPSDLTEQEPTPRRASNTVRWGATIMPIRSGADGGLEVLCAQNTAPCAKGPGALGGLRG